MGTTRCSSRLLDLFGLYHLRAGNTIEVGGESLLVDEACGGIQSFYTMLACILFVILWTRCRFSPGLILLLAGLFWAIVANVVRVVAVIVLTTACGWDATTGWRHEVLSWLSFALCLFLTWNTRQLLLFLIPRSLAAHWELGTRNGECGANNHSVPHSPFRIPSLEGLTGWPILVGYGTLAGWQWALLAATPVLAPAETLRMPWTDRQQLAQMGEETLPAHLGPWKRERFEFVQRGRNDSWGRCSYRWSYRSGDVQAVVSLDYPFAGWHELSVCYERIGWQVAARETYPQQEGEEPTLVRVRLSRPVGMHGFLWFALFDGQGHLLSPSLGQSENERWQRPRSLAALVRAWRQGQALPPSRMALRSVGQVQVFVQHPGPLTLEQQEQAQRLFDQARPLLAPAETSEGP